VRCVLDINIHIKEGAYGKYIKIAVTFPAKPLEVKVIPAFMNRAFFALIRQKISELDALLIRIHY